MVVLLGLSINRDILLLSNYNTLQCINTTENGDDR